MLPAPHPDSSPGVLGSEGPRVPQPALSVRDQWAAVNHRVSWIESQFHSMEVDHARQDGRGEARPLFSSIKALALIALMRAALAVLDELSELIPQ